jgi:thiol-disulfide isomerase/thioredoxin
MEHDETSPPTDRPSDDSADAAAADPLQIYADPPEEQETAVHTPPAETAAAAPATTPRRSGVLLFAALALVAVLAMQIVLLVQSNQTRSDVDALTEDVQALADDVVDVEASLAAAGAAASAAPTLESLPPGSLPPFDPNQPNDAALGMQLGTVTGTEYYTATPATIDPADDTHRVWLVWAHWCPHCQDELPEVSAWYRENAENYPNVELVTVTTAIDPSRGNPLAPYLDESQFPFPVIVDEELTIASQLGSSAFPFWMVTDGSGTVLVRIPGAVGIGTVEQIFSQLDDLAST